MRPVDKSKFRTYLDKGDQHQRAGSWCSKEKDYDAAITNLSIAIINYLDALSVNRFGKDLSSDNHEAAPTVLQKSLSGIGISDFKDLVVSCIAVLKMKNLASYRSESLTVKNVTEAQRVTKQIKAYVQAKLDVQITPEN